MSNGDTIRRFLLEQQNVRGSLVRLDDTWQAIAGNGEYTPDVHRLLGEAAAATSLLGRNLKFSGRLTLQIRSQSSLQLLLVQSDNELNLRGLANADADAAGDLAGLVGDGTLAITVESGAKPERYQSIVPLEQDDLAGCLAQYYRRSVQLPTVFLLDASPARACGLMLQALPDNVVSDDSWERLAGALRGLDVARLAGLDDDVLFPMIFPEDDVRLYDAEPVNFRCECSEERVRNTLRVLGPTELGELVADNVPVEVRCEFCNQLYSIEPETVWDIIADLSGVSSAPQ